jgi:hypothetical protein
MLASITRLIAELERKPGEPTTIRALGRRFAMKSRRLYDVINVFSSLGCCEKSDLEGFTWRGLHHAPGKVRELREIRGADDPHRSLVDLFPPRECVGIAHLTGSFLLLYYVLKRNVLNLKTVAKFLSRGTPRCRSTLCKLYQISFVLCAVGITARTSSKSEIWLSSGYTDFHVLGSETHDESNPASLETLLNHRESGPSMVYRRRRELEEICTSRSPTKTGSAVGKPVRIT